MRRIRNLMIQGTAALFLLLSCEIPALVESPEYIDPEAHISITTEDLPGLDGRYETGSVLNLNGSSSTEGDGELSSYSWDFGDGSTAEGESVSHTYAASGTYTVRLTISDSNGQTGEDTAEVVMNLPPTAVISTGDMSLTLGESVTLGSDGTQDPDGTVVSYSWNTGDGSSAEGASFTHTYASVGVYTAVLTVTDDQGTTDSDSVTLTVTAPPNSLPEADAGSDKTLTYDAAETIITVDGSASSDSDGTIVSWDWNFTALPAESTLTDDSLSIGTDGIVSFDISGESGAAMAEGSLTYELTLTVTDDRGGTDSDSVLISITGTGTVIIGIE